MLDLNTLLNEISSGDEARAAAAAEHFAAHGNPATLALGELLNNGNADTRWWALRALAEFNSPTAINFICQGLQDPDVAVQQCAALALRERPNEGAVPELAALLDSQDRMLAHLAADALAAAGKASTTALLEIAEHGSKRARLEAVRALAQIGDHDSIATLFNLLDEDSALLEYWANAGLDKMGIGMTFFKPGW